MSHLLRAHLLGVEPRVHGLRLGGRRPRRLAVARLHARLAQRRHGLSRVGRACARVAPQRRGMKTRGGSPTRRWGGRFRGGRFRAPGRREAAAAVSDLAAASLCPPASLSGSLCAARRCAPLPRPAARPRRPPTVAASCPTACDLCFTPAALLLDAALVRVRHTNTPGCPRPAPFAACRSWGPVGRARAA